MFNQTLNQTSTFEQALSENLSLYLATPSNDDTNLFQANREIAIARYALTKQAESYYSAINILSTFLNSSTAEKVDQNTLTNIMTAIATIEMKSRSLIETVHSVIQLLKDASEIDIDKSALRTIVVNMPVLVRQSINKITGDDSLAESISLSLNNQISDLLTACRLERDTLLPSTSTNAQERGINPEQFVDLFNTVPTSPNSQLLDAEQPVR